MGMKARVKSRSWYRTQIRRINRTFSDAVRQGADEPRLDRLRSVKDELIDELVAYCPHDKLLESPPESGFGMMSRTAARGCLLCGEVEYATGEWAVLKGDTERVDRRTFTVRIGRVLKDLGINL